MKRILIIGGTGMLRDATDYFIANDYHVSIVGRKLYKLTYFTQKYPHLKTIELICQDYYDTAHFLNKVKTSVEQNGDFDIVVSWIHSDAVNTLQQLLDLFSKNKGRTKFYHLKGSNFLKTKQDTDMNTELDYREIYLGFKVENNVSRWLTHAEISDGTIEAVTNNKSMFIIGQIKPAELRP